MFAVYTYTFVLEPQVHEAILISPRHVHSLTHVILLIGAHKVSFYINTVECVPCAELEGVGNGCVDFGGD
jgi:hypothetical protein